MTTSSPEDQAAYERMQQAVQANRAHNVAKMDEAGVPRAARRGFFKAACYNYERIQEITAYQRPVSWARGSRWGVFVAYSDESYSPRTAWIVGPRGSAQKLRGRVSRWHREDDARSSPPSEFAKAEHAEEFARELQLVLKCDVTHETLTSMPVGTDIEA